MPDDYPLFRAAQWLGVAPWDLARQSIYWLRRALFFMEAEASARAARRDLDEAAVRRRG